MFLNFFFENLSSGFSLALGSFLGLDIRLEYK